MKGSPADPEKDVLVVFVKAPIPGEVKTRLVPALTPLQAAELYQCFVRDIVRAMSRGLRGAELCVAYQPHARFPDPSWIGRMSLPFFLQEGQALGERLQKAFGQCFREKARRVVIIGSDSPGLPVRFVEEAFRMLGSTDVVLGPATDGGYYLVGASRLFPGLFEGVSWSTEEVFERTLSNASRLGYDLKTLPAYPDIDTIEDLEAFHKSATEGSPGATAHLTVLYVNRLLKRRTALST